MRCRRALHPLLSVLVNRLNKKIRTSKVASLHSHIHLSRLVFNAGLDKTPLQSARLDAEISTGTISRYEKNGFVEHIHIYIHVHIYTNVLFSPIGILFSPAAGLSSCSRLRGTRGARADPIGKFEQRPRSVARVLGGKRGTPARGGIPTM